MAYKLLLSDADNTLFDFEAGEKNAIADTFRAFNIPVTPQNVATYHRVNDAQWKRLERGETTQARLRTDRFVDFLRETALSADPSAMCDYFVERLGQQRILMPGAKAFCAHVAARMPIYLVTNGIAAVQRSRFERCELAPLLTDLVISEEIGFSKPDPAMVLEALRRAGVAAGEAVLLGDSVTADIPAAHRAGVDSILLTNGRTPPQGHGATFVADTLAQAEALILG